MEDGVIINQTKVTAIPAWLDLLDVKSFIITIDAMGCQENIIRKDADDVLAVKDDQKQLHEE